MKTLLVVVAVAAAVFLIKPNKIHDEIKQVVSPQVDEVKEVNSTEHKKSVRNMRLNNSRIITLFGPVDEVSVKAAVSKLSEMQSSTDPVFLLLDSPGGSVLDGAQLISAMEASKAPVNTVCMRMCASMAFVIHQYGVKRMAVDRSILMAHPASGGSGPGQIDNIVSLLRMIQTYIEKSDTYIAKRAGLDPAVFHNMIAHELWLDAEDATNRHFNDELVFIQNDVSPASTNHTDERLKNFRR